MREAVGEGWIDDDLEPALGHEAAVRRDRIAAGRLHPGIRRQDPECRQRGPDGDETSRQEMQPAPDPVEPEQHHPDEARFQEERGRSEEHTSELQSLMRISYAVLRLKKKKKKQQ